MSYNDKKFLDVNGLKHLISILDDYPTNEVLGTVINAIESEIPTNVSQLQNDAGYLTAHQDISGKANSADLAAVATSGDYDDLINKPTIPAVPVQDVQINGTSVITNGVANVPVATASQLGTVFVNPSLGLYVAGTGSLTVNPAGSPYIKAGTNGYFPIVSSKQHEATFYGLAKAAGDSTQSASDNAVGTYTADASAAIRNMLGAVGDVQVDGTSIVQNNVANIPISSGSGLAYDGTNLKANTASDTSIKTGTSNSALLTPGRQHQAVFYGLAKAAGDTTQSASSNTVGTYTAEAKSAIQSMLGIDLQSIASEVEIPLVETVSGTTPTISGQPNTRYICGEVSTLSITPPSAGSIDVIFDSGSTPAVITVPNTVRWPVWFDATALEADTTYEILITDGVYGSVMTWAN